MQKVFNFLITLICFGVLLLIALPTTTQAREEKEAFERGLIVLASTSMTNAMHEILKNFSQSRNISVSSSFSSTENLASSIEDGEPANILISEDPKRMRELQRRGVLNVFSLSTLASDKLVIVMPKRHYLINKIGKYKTIKEKLNFLMNNSIMVIPDPQSDPAGAFIEQAFRVMGLKKKSESKTIKTDNNRRAAYLATHANNTAIVYASDILSEDNLTVIGEIPQKYYDRIIYQVAIVAEISGQSNLSDAEAFVKYLKSDEAVSIFKKYGFGKI